MDKKTTSRKLQGSNILRFLQDHPHIQDQHILAAFLKFPPKIPAFTMHA